ncbi:hypothetical protein GCM10009665_51390 [Kitasatospora nipponensis]|uniref:Saccharopine dehydrogenase-like protein n=1 Tax=Kitasatospora nipponensis TaxID=258049 RepID=A0ABN1WPY7_9ACTN
MPESISVPAARTGAVPGQPAAASGTVHWVGVGLSTGSTGLGLLCDQARRVVLWGRTEQRATERLAALGLTGRAEPRALEPGALAGEVRAGDVVVSMLPADRHGELLRLCVERGAHFACSSYVSPAILAESEDAARAGLVVLTEAGLDPGIDHLLAHRLVALGTEALGEGPAQADFTSYCGGVPAVPNDFTYRFSWAPRGVLTALGSPARYLENGEPLSVPHPWQATRPLILAGERFEVYPNRDSVPFVEQYGFPSAWQRETFVRGTLRLAGWQAAWEQVFDTVRSGDAERITALADELAQRYPTTATDLDRVVLTVALRLRTPQGASWSGTYLLDLVGDERESAMARCVSVPLALGVGRILAGALPAGLHRAVREEKEVEHWLAQLAEYGLTAELSTGF